MLGVLLKDGALIGAIAALAVIVCHLRTVLIERFPHFGLRTSRLLLGADVCGTASPVEPHKIVSNDL
jgi:hypothetical protein